MSTFTNFNGPESTSGNLFLQKQIDELKAALTNTNGNLETFKADLEMLAQGLEQLVKTKAVQTERLQAENATIDTITSTSIKSDSVDTKKVKSVESEMKDALITGNAHFVPEWKSAIVCNHYHILAKLDDKERSAITFVRSADANDAHGIKATVIWTSESIAAVFANTGYDGKAIIRYGVYYDGKETFLVLYGKKDNGINGSTIFGNTNFEAASINALNVTSSVSLSENNKVVEIDANKKGGFNAAPFAIADVTFDSVNVKKFHADEAEADKLKVGVLTTDDIRGTDGVQLAFNDSAVEFGNTEKPLVLKSKDRPIFEGRQIALLHDVDGIGFIYMGSHTAFMTSAPTVDEIPINETEKYTFQDSDTVLVGDPSTNAMKLFTREAGHWNAGIDIPLDIVKTYQYYVNYQNFDASSYWVPANIIWNMSLEAAPYIFINEYPIENMYTKGQVDNKDEAIKTLLTQKIEKEVTDREAAVEAEKQARELADATEQEARINKDTELEAKINNVEQNAQNNVQAAVEAEKQARELADTEIKGLIDAEKLRAQEKETRIFDALTQEVSNRQQGDTVLQQSLSSEEQSRIAKDAEISQQVQAVSTDLTQAKTTLQQNIDAVDAAYKAADVQINSDISRIEGEYKAADTAINVSIAGIAASKLDKISDVTTKDQMYIKRANGTQAMLDLSEGAEGKLDKVTTVTPKDQMYVKKADGSQTMLDVSESAEGKLDKVTTVTDDDQFYIKKADGTQAMLNLTEIYGKQDVINVTKHTIPQYPKVKSYNPHPTYINSCTFVDSVGVICSKDYGLLYIEHPDENVKNSNITTGTFEYAASSQSTWVACSNSNSGLYYSDDAKSWTPSNIATGNFVHCIFRVGKWVACNYSNKGLYYSNDGKIWTQSSVNAGNFKYCDQANGIYVACSVSNSGLYHSLDGKTWTHSNITTGNFIYCKYAKGIWVACNNGSGLYYSVDGKTWTQSNVTTGNICNCEYANGLFVACSCSGKGLYKSGDGKTWAQSNITAGSFRYCVFAKGMCAACSNDNKGIYFSGDGENWVQSNQTTGNFIYVAVGDTFYFCSTTLGIYRAPITGVFRKSSLTTGNFRHCANANGIWVACSNDVKGLCYSTDGKSWAQSNITTNDFRHCANANGIWVACSDDNKGLYYSTDGKSWVQSNITTDDFYHCANANGIWVACSSSKGLYYSTDGKSWVQSNITTDDFYHCANANGIWVACSDDNKGLYYFEPTIEIRTPVYFINTSHRYILLFDEDGADGNIFYMQGLVSYNGMGSILFVDFMKHKKYFATLDRKFYEEDL